MLSLYCDVSMLPHKSSQLFHKDEHNCVFLMVIKEATELPEEGVIGEVVAYGGKLYVWSGDK